MTDKIVQEHTPEVAPLDQETESVRWLRLQIPSPNLEIVVASGTRHGPNSRMNWMAAVDFATTKSNRFAAVMDDVAALKPLRAWQSDAVRLAFTNRPDLLDLMRSPNAVCGRWNSLVAGVFHREVDSNPRWVDSLALFILGAPGGPVLLYRRGAGLFLHLSGADESILRGRTFFGADVTLQACDPPV